MTVLQKRIVNFRFFPALFFSVCIGSLLASLVFDKPFYDYYVLGICLVLGVVVTLATRGKGILILSCIVALLLGYVLCSGQIEDARLAEKNLSSELVTVRVEYVEDGVVCVSIKDGLVGVDGLCEFDTSDVYDYPLDIGNELTLGGVRVSKLDVKNSDGSLNTYFFNSRTRYTLTATELIGFSEGGRNIVEAMRSGIISATQNLPDDIRGITIALLTGDKYAVSDEVYDGYKVSGTAHVLAVSGMHVGFLVIFFEWLLKRFKLKRIVRIFILLPVMLFLCALCDFTPSVVRSSVMVGVHLLIPVFTNRRYDMLSSMSFAGVIIVLSNPMSVYSYGFLLSYGSVFGIVLFGRTFERLLSRLPKFLSQTVSISLATTVGVFPLSVYMFGEFSLLSVLTNALVLPVLTVGYGVLVGLACIAVIFPPFSFVIVGGSWLVYYLNFVTGFIASVDMVSVGMSAPLWFCCAYYVFAILLSDFINLKKTTKRLIAIAFIVLGCAYFSFFCNFSPKSF